MNAVEDTRGRRSIVSDTLQVLLEQAQQWREKIGLLEAGQPLDRAETVAELNKLLDLSQNLRDAILSEDNAAQWHTKEELRTVVARLDELAAKRSRYLELAQRLTAGTVIHRRERTREERLQQRDAAVAELMEVSALPSPPPLPGPGVDEWLPWACSLDDSTHSPDLKTLNTFFPRLDDFVRQLEIEMWRDGSAAPEKPDHADGLRIEEAAQPENRPAFYAEAITSPEESASATSAAHIPEPADGNLLHMPHAATVGGPSFFAADEVDSLASCLDKSRKEPNEPREVQALLAISHWLQPWDQNPVLQTQCSIATAIGYTDHLPQVAVSPAEAGQAIAAARELPLLVGGADLLRWSLERRAAGHLDTVAAVRRLTPEHLNLWFGDIFKIELAEPQVQDMYRLTYGIPLLVGELHRRIIPIHDAPPTWIGYAIWTRVKQAFDAQIPVLAQELKNGPDNVRLTERELALLKMVVLASDDSTADTLAGNLMEHWHKYRHPELAPLGTADEASLRVLQTLGLLPIRGGWTSQPIAALVPVDADDPIRQIVSHL